MRQELKAQGNAVYKVGLTEQARAKWQKAMKMLGNLFDIETAEQACPSPKAIMAAFCCML